jgi:hypothetical protein
MHTFVKVFLELFFIDLFRVFIKYIPYSSTSRGIVTLCNLHLILTFNFFNLICCEGYRHGYLYDIIRSDVLPRGAVLLLQPVCLN